MDPDGLTTMLIPLEEVGPREKVVRMPTPSTHSGYDEMESTYQTGPAASPIVICTAVPLSIRDTSLIFRHRADSTSEASSLSLEDEDVSEPSPPRSLQTFQLYSVILGLLVGCFIQLSSLGANYLLAELYHDDKPNAQTIIRYSLFWSVLTSVMGVAVLFLIRELVLAAYRANKSTRNLSIVLHLECYFAIGTLTGVCLAWTCTDVLLGFRAHFVHSLGTLFAALVWCKCITGFFAPEDASQSDDTAAPLMQEVTAIPDCDDTGMADLVNSSRFKISSLTLGIITGFFIQFSSLGANFALSHFVLPTNPAPPAVAIFSLIWSIVTSGMGTVILTLARGMIIYIYSMDRSYSTDDTDDDDDDVIDSSLLRLEVFFAVGALLGVNVAWMGTDLIMGLQVQYLHALATEVLVILAVGLTFRCNREHRRTRSKHVPSVFDLEP